MKIDGPDTFVILTVRGWDGSRILGLFKNKEEALAAKNEMLNRHTPDTLAVYTTNKEEYIFDTVTLGRSSYGCEILMSSASDCSLLFRKHLYKDLDS